MLPSQVTDQGSDDSTEAFGCSWMKRSRILRLPRTIDESLSKSFKEFGHYNNSSSGSNPNHPVGGFHLYTSNSQIHSINQQVMLLYPQKYPPLFGPKSQLHLDPVIPYPVQPFPTFPHFAKTLQWVLAIHLRSTKGQSQAIIGSRAGHLIGLL